MAKKKSSKKPEVHSKKSPKKESPHKKNVSLPKTMELKTEHDIAMDFAVKISQQFNKLVKSIILFGSTAKKEQTLGSDIDIIMIIDDASISWDQELIAWYREELEKIIHKNPYKQSLHINTVKLSTWWEDLIRGDPLVINVLRYGESLIDFGGFFEPLKFLLVQGKIHSSPEAIYSCLQRAPMHLARSKSAELEAVDGLYWAMVDSAHAALIANHVSPPSPEHITEMLKDNFVSSGKLKPKYAEWYRDLTILHKKITHHEISDLKGIEIDDWQKRTEEFLSMMAQLVKELVM